MIPASHPRHCRGCDGTGFQPAPPLVSKAGGMQVVYSQVQPCEHVWWDDDPDQEHITLEQYLTRVAVRGDYDELERWERFLGKR